MNVILPVAAGNRAGQTDYMQSLQEIRRKTILQYVFEALSEVETSHFAAVVRREDANRFHIDSIIHLLRGNVDVVVSEGDTKGSACTCLLAIDHIDPSEELLIVNSDQMITEPYAKILAHFAAEQYDAGVVIFEDVHPRWSFVRLDEAEQVIEAAEKRPISRNATAGFYYFRQAEFFLEAARRMILKKAHVNGKYYVCPCLNELILAQKRIGVYHIEKSQYFKFTEPSALEEYSTFLRGRDECTQRN